MDIIITADSTCDLPDYLVQENDIVILPLSILLGENSYLDGIEIHPKDIYEHVAKTGELPKTAAVTPQQYTDVFKQITDDGKAVVHIGLSSAISSSYQNAVVAASEFDNVYCVDSKSLCTGMGLLVLKACDLRNKKFDAKKIARRLEGLVSKGGRCGAVARFGANVLGLKPSIAVSTETGKLDVAKKYRGKIDIVYKQYISDCLQNSNKIDKTRVVIANSGGVNPDIIAYAKGIAEGRGFKQIITADAGCTISSHCGPKTLAVFFMEE